MQRSNNANIISIRYHNPNEPLSRSLFAKIIIWLTQLILSFIGYYFLASVIHGIDYFSRYGENPFIIVNEFPIHFWVGICYGMFVVKLFNPIATISGILTAELIIEYNNYPNPIKIVLLGFILWNLVILSLKPYKGGEYTSADHLKTQFGSYLLIVIGYIPILIFGFKFNFIFSEDLTLITARIYLILNYITQMAIIIPINWFSFWALDRLLNPYFPLTEDEKKELQQFEEDMVLEEENPDDIESDNSWVVPQPGELYLNILTHHSLYDDDHTIVIPVGKVRIYLCTRCTAMIIGGVIGLIGSTLLFFDLGIEYNQNWTFWLGISLPILPLLDWGLQSLKIRPATTWSRLLTGFCLGLSMHLISISYEYIVEVGIVVAIYMVIFVILLYFRSRKESDEFLPNFNSIDESEITED